MAGNAIQQAIITPENDSREILTQALMFDLALAIRWAQGVGGSRSWWQTIDLGKGCIPSGMRQPKNATRAKPLNPKLQQPKNTMRASRSLYVPLPALRCL